MRLCIKCIHYEAAFCERPTGISVVDGRAEKLMRWCMTERSYINLVDRLLYKIFNDPHCGHKGIFYKDKEG